MTKQVINVGRKGDAPTMARLRVAPKVMVIILSSGVRTPNERRPEILINMKAAINTKAPREPICSMSKFFPWPKSSVKKFMNV